MSTTLDQLLIQANLIAARAVTQYPEFLREDARQDALLRVCSWLRKRNLRQTSWEAFTAIVHRAVQCAAIDCLRRERRFRPLERMDWGVRPVVAQALEQRSEIAQRLGQLAQSGVQMLVRVAEVLASGDVPDSLSELAAKVGTTPSALHTALCRFRKRLAQASRYRTETTVITAGPRSSQGPPRARRAPLPEGVRARARACPWGSPAARANLL